MSADASAEADAHVDTPLNTESTTVTIAYDNQFMPSIYNTEYQAKMFCCLFLLYILATSKVIPAPYRLVTVCTHAEFIVLPHWDTKSPAP